MAFTQLTSALNIIASLSQTPNETDGLSATEVQAKFDEASGLIKTYINSTLLTELESQGASASLGAVVSGVAGTLQEFIDNVESAGAGSLPPANSVTNSMMATANKTGVLTDITFNTYTSLALGIQGVYDTLNALITTDASNLTTHIADRELHNPAGTILNYAGGTSPSGYLECDGSAVSRTTYSALFTAIGTTFGSGDGSTTFNIPDLRGEFVRGWDNGKGTDSGRVFGSSQTEDVGVHNHTGSSSGAGAHTHSYDTYSSTDLGAGGSGDIPKTETSGTTGSAGTHTHTITINNSTGTETRPRNIALMYIIKY